MGTIATKLLFAGIVCILAAIVGGGLEAFNIKISPIQSWRRQVGLGLAGAVLIAVWYFWPTPLHATPTIWGPAKQRPPGVCLETCDGDFIPWNALKKEIEEAVLRQVVELPDDSTVKVADCGNKKDWTINVVDRDEKFLGYLWFGPDPDREWAWDGLVRVGLAAQECPASRRSVATVWETFARYSDRTYRRQRPTHPVTPQETRWGPVDALGPGVCLGSCGGQFVPWSMLRVEIERRLLPQVEGVSKQSIVRLAALHGKDNWNVLIVDEAGAQKGKVWFGPDPGRPNWPYDGLVRVGTISDTGTPVVWGIFQRYSDGSYRARATGGP